MTTLTDNETTILSSLQFRARTAHSEVARQLKLNHSTVLNTVERLRSKIELNPCLRVNLQGLGLHSYTLLASLSSLGAIEYDSLTRHISQLPSVNAVLAISGTFDLLVEIYTDGETDIDCFLGQVTGSLGAVFAKTCMMKNRYWHSFDKSVLFTQSPMSVRPFVTYCNSERIAVDNSDFRIIEAVSSSPLISIRELGRVLDIPHQTAHLRFARLCELGILLGVEYTYRLSRLGHHSFLMLLRADVTPEQERLLTQFCQRSIHVVGLGRRQGEWNFQIDFEVTETREIEMTRLELLRLLGNVVVDTALMSYSRIIKWQHNIWSHRLLVGTPAIAQTDVPLVPATFRRA
jgi:DNA-binding Lrp family transcriptional regulator